MTDKIDTLKNLEKIAHHKVEDVQKELTQTLSAQAHLATRISATEQQILQEEDALAEDIHMRSYFEQFEKRCREKITKLEEEIQTLQQHEAYLRAQLADHFAEEKRYQILLQRKQEELKKEKDKKNQAQMDEIAATRQALKAFDVSS